MIHKFVSNDNKGNVNVFEVTSTGTKLGKVAPPVEDTDVATKKYVDDNAGSGSSLPTVTASDNGKVLVVNDGAWAAGTLYVLVTKENGVASLSGSDINSLAASGVEVLFKDSDGLYAYSAASGTSAVFTGLSYALDIKKIVVSNNKSISRTTKTFYSKPSGGIPETDLAQGVKDKLNKFVVTLTPTSPDYSGTMDKTVAEINAAYEAGQEIVFHILTSATEYADFPLAFAAVIDPFQYMNFGANFFYATANTLIVLETIATDDGTKRTYGTTIYPLTPAS